MKKKIFTSLGLMSGTSMDGVDLSLIKTDGHDYYAQITDKYYEFDDQLYKKLIYLRENIKSAEDLKKKSTIVSEIEKKFTLFNAKIIEEFIDKEFSSLKVHINLIKLNGFYELDDKYFISNSDLINEVFLVKKPKILDKQEIKKHSLQKFSINKFNSLVLCPLGIEYPIGILFVQYKSEMMGVDFKFDLLNSLSETISHSLEQFIQK